jgi:hypothetical protein
MKYDDIDFTITLGSKVADLCRPKLKLAIRLANPLDVPFSVW